MTTMIRMLTAAIAQTSYEFISTFRTGAMASALLRGLSRSSRRRARTPRMPYKPRMRLAFGAAGRVEEGMWFQDVHAGTSVLSADCGHGAEVVSVLVPAFCVSGLREPGLRSLREERWAANDSYSSLLIEHTVCLRLGVLRHLQEKSRLHCANWFTCRGHLGVQM